MLSRRSGLFIILSGLVWAYLVVKACIMPMAHDEIATFFYFVQPGSFLPFLSKWEANNHILNSALTTLSCHLFGSGYLSLRLANLLFFPVFAWYVIRFAAGLKSVFLSWIFFLSLIFAHHFIEFFALSRGYGMSMALMTGALWHLYNTFRHNMTGDYFKGLLFMSLAIAANLSLMNTLFILIISYSLHYIFTVKGSSLKSRLLRVNFIVLLGLAPAIFFSVYSFAMKERGLLYYGTMDGFLKVSVDTLSFLLTGSHSLLLRYYILVVFVCSIVSMIFILKTQKWEIKKLPPGYLFVILLLGNILASILLEIILHVNYPEDRVALYFFPLFIGFAVFLFDGALPEMKRSWRLIPFTLIAPLLLLPLHLLSGINLKYAFNYKNDYLPENFYQIVKQAHTKGEFPATIGGYRTRHFAWSMHDFRNGGTESQIYFTDYPGLLADYQIANLEDSPDWLLYYDTIAHEQVNDRYLLRRKQPLAKRQILVIDSISTNGQVKDEFFNLFRGSVDPAKGSSLYISADLSVMSPSRPFSAWVVFNIKDKEKNDLRYECIPLDWLRPLWDGTPSNFKNGMILNELPEDSDQLLVYVWNIRKAPFSVENGNLMVSILVPDH